MQAAAQQNRCLCFIQMTRVGLAMKTKSAQVSFKRSLS